MNNEQPKPPQPLNNDGQKTPMWIGLVVIGVIIVGITLYAFNNDSDPELTPIDSAAEFGDSLDKVETEENMATTVKTFDLTGKNFEFSMEEILVNKGDTVRITFASSQGFHDWAIDEFNAATDQVNPGTTTEVEFVADQVGTFEYYCDVGNHRQQGMVGKLIVK